MVADKKIKGPSLIFQKDADQIYPGWKEKLGYTGVSSAHATCFVWQKKATAAASEGSAVSAATSNTYRRALDQSSCCAVLSMVEEDLIKNGNHVLDAYIMKPVVAYVYLATDAHFAAESSTGTNVNVCTTDDFIKTMDALGVYIDLECEEMKIAYPNALFERNIIDGRAMMCSMLTLTIGNNQGMGDVEYGKIYDIYFPPSTLRLFDRPAVNIKEYGGLVVGTIIKLKLGLQPTPFGVACYAFWQEGDFIKNVEPQGNQTFCQRSDSIPELAAA